MKSTDIIRVTKVNLDYGWISNMSPHSIDYDGYRFPTAEHLFIWLRLKDRKNHINRILSTTNPVGIKRLSKRLIKDGDWEYEFPLLSQEDVNTMKKVVSLKLEQHPELVEKLVNTMGKIIIEDVSKRASIKTSSLFWGSALIGEDDPLIESRWVGYNMLGIIYMELREEYFKQKYQK